MAELKTRRSDAIVLSIRGKKMGEEEEEESESRVALREVPIVNGADNDDLT